MDVFYSVDTAANCMNHGALAIGNFDGVHIGHQALLKKALSVKGAYNSGVLTFSPHPQNILKKIQHTCLTPDNDKIRILSTFGLDVAIIQPVSHEFLTLSPQRFVEDILVKKLGVDHVIVGHDFSFGEKAQGNTELLEQLGLTLGFSVHIIPPVMVNQQRCSSSTIRELLSLGHITKANAMLGRHYSLRGTVVTGNRLGGPLGFNTANLRPFAGFFMRHAIYASITRVYDAQGYKDYVSATNVGVRPTVSDDNMVVVESHCLDSNPELYGKDIEVFFIDYIRDEEKFASITSLKEQVQRDCRAIRQMSHDHPQLFQVAG
jgi:riboflavin kinase / FMN adenylyltransferase